jgi:uncharacterized peroxidase-related enzyme
MSGLPVLTLDTAPEPARASLERAQRVFGFVPNLIGVLANAPIAAQAYLSLTEIFGSGTLSEIERQVVLLTVSFTHGCEYCMAAHSTVARMVHMPEPVLEALRTGRPLPDDRLETLRRTTAALVTTRGWLSDAERQRFAAAGYTDGQLLEVVVGIALKTLSNYTNHLASTPVDAAFAPNAWRQVEVADATGRG